MKPPSSSATTLLFAITLFTSAALVFVVEPMFGKMVLPRLGGTPAVWNTCMVFYQAVLLGGYAYAHLLTTRLRPRTQVVLHVSLLLAGVLALPVTLPPDWTPPTDHSPIPSLFAALLSGVGVPLLVLSATAPLLQRWFSATSGERARDPYFLYAASNVGSILALLAYPLVIEPSSSLVTQGAQWSVGYILLMCLTAACGALMLAAGRTPASTVMSAGEAMTPPDALEWKRRLRWLALSLVPSSVMLAVTTYISTDVGSVPLLWTIPLALYLLSFILGFATRRLFPNQWLAGAATVTLIVLACVWAIELNRPIALILALHLLALFLIALSLHSALADDRPSPAHLTEFYFWIAVGGVAGGLFNTLLAPLLFTSIAEYPSALAAAAWLIHRGPIRDLLRPRTVLAAAITALAGAAFVSFVQSPDPNSVILGLVLAVMIMGFLFSSRTAAGFGLAVTLLLALAPLSRQERGDLVYARRTFFGVLRVWNLPDEQQHRIAHGTTIHGVQSTAPAHSRDPLSYYHPDGPVGQVFGSLHDKLTDARIAVVGLGAGSLTAYAQPGQTWTFFEIDPEVERVARNPKLFTYLRDCGSRCTVQLGDARLALGRITQRYDLIVLDAFSSDAIPVHLLTREAMAMYVDHLADGGTLVFHISNRHLALRSLVGRLAMDRHLVARAQYYQGGTKNMMRTSSEWVAMARHASSLGPIETDARWEWLAVEPETRAWSDDFSNILSVLKQ